MLLECEGMDGNLMPGYNAILYVSGAAAVGGLLENGRGRMLGAVVPALATHWLVGVQHREFERLRAQARRQPRWWNRRLQHQERAPAAGKTQCGLRLGSSGTSAAWMSSGMARWLTVRSDRARPTIRSTAAGTWAVVVMTQLHPGKVLTNKRSRFSSG